MKAQWFRVLACAVALTACANYAVAEKARNAPPCPDDRSIWPEPAKCVYPPCPAGKQCLWGPDHDKWTRCTNERSLKVKEVREHNLLVKRCSPAAGRKIPSSSVVPSSDFAQRPTPDNAPPAAKTTTQAQSAPSLGARCQIAAEACRNACAANQPNSSVSCIDEFCSPKKFQACISKQLSPDALRATDVFKNK